MPARLSEKLERIVLHVYNDCAESLAVLCGHIAQVTAETTHNFTPLLREKRPRAIQEGGLERFLVSLLKNLALREIKQSLAKRLGKL